MKKAKLIAGMTTQLAATVLRAPLSRRSSRGGGSHMRLRWLLVILSAVVPLLIGPISAQAATASSTAHTAATSPAPQVAAPTGCPKGDVCFYYQGNGGTSTLCGYTDTNSTNLHGLAPFGATCSNIGPSGSIYNNGNTCSGCSGTKLYYDNAYAGAWYCLPMGGYLLHIEQNHFYGGGSGADGHGQTLAYHPKPPNGPGPGGVASVHWTTC